MDFRDFVNAMMYENGEMRLSGRTYEEFAREHLWLLNEEQDQGHMRDSLRYAASTFRVNSNQNQSASWQDIGSVSADTVMASIEVLIGQVRQSRSEQKPAQIMVMPGDPEFMHDLSSGHPRAVDQIGQWLYRACQAMTLGGLKPERFVCQPRLFNFFEGLCVQFGVQLEKSNYLGQNQVGMLMANEAGDTLVRETARVRYRERREDGSSPLWPVARVRPEDPVPVDWRRLNAAPIGHHTHTDKVHVGCHCEQCEWKRDYERFCLYRRHNAGCWMEKCREIYCFQCGFKKVGGPYANITDHAPDCKVKFMPNEVKRAFNFGEEVGINFPDVNHRVDYA